MEQIKTYLEQVISLTGLSGDSVAVVRYGILVIVAFVLAWLAGWLCRQFLVPILLKITSKTDVAWDDVIFNERVLNAASRIIPAIVIWVLLPHVFYEFPKVEDIVGRLTAIYFTIMAVRTVIVFIDSFRHLENGTRTARQQYLYSICSVLKILMVFVSVIVVVAIIIDKSPATLFAGLGAASAILMLAFQDTIKGLVAGIRLTSNDMLHIGDWITVPGAGANGKVEEISLTMVKVRNFDNTIVTVTPQMLVDGAFQNWQGMVENEGRK
ncbi:MAG: mechanosensitive ion channel, partial [Prevotella sp.]|nr:mechanosensitive ion channel [Prevotella sp.]